MNLGEKLTLLRKQKGINQADLAKSVGVSREIIGKYERNEVLPSIEVAAKIARTLEASLDWLVGNIDIEFDTATLNRIQDIDKLSPKDKELVFEFLDAFLSNRKIKKALQK